MMILRTVQAIQDHRYPTKTTEPDDRPRPTAAAARYDGHVRLAAAVVAVGAALVGVFAIQAPTDGRQPIATVPTTVSFDPAGEASVPAPTSGGGGSYGPLVAE